MKSMLYEELRDEQAAALVEKLLGAKLKAARLLTGGLFNTTYLVETEDAGDVILRLGPVNRHLLLPYELHLMEAEVEVDRLCARHGVPASEVLACDLTKTTVDRDVMIVRRIPAVPYSEVGLTHEERLAILADALSPAQRDRAFKGLVEATDLARTTVYFSHYLFDTYIKMGRSDLFLKRLDLWREYVKMNLCTPLEAPGANARSDCHAWGSHPLYHLHTGVLGVRSDAPFFAKVRIAPQPADLQWIKAKTPHPQGLIETDLKFADGGVSGTVILPGNLTGTFEWKGNTLPLNPGSQSVSLR